ncbi:ClpP/crotonase [Diaporthe amygdali]|uniref:ClpP/crotonase n=1 Tax=Phomopsis amygdali TaxID=1214568 RepID=UPI0022FED78D|nr:ClpP/crotonase [Diaporthe amygdali]KAJ0120676.1 ClpP/crotonase [Diaporthe amygdali]
MRPYWYIFISLAGLAAAAAIPTNNSASSFIVTTKVTSSYWRASFSNPPFNIQTTAFYLDFFALVDRIASDPDVKVVVFDSAVPDFWLSHFDVLTPPSNATSSATASASYWGNITRLADLPVLTIASIRGIARGGGAELATCLDVRFASREKAVFGQPEVGLGVIPGGGGLELLPRLTGRSRALEIVIGADDLDSETAAAYGWINRAIPDDDFETFVDTFARRVAGWDRQGIASAKRIINERSGFPTLVEFQESYKAFQAGFTNPVVVARIVATAKAGLQTSVEFEKNLGDKLTEFVDGG